MSNMTVKELIMDATETLHKQGYSPRRCKYVILAWKQFLNFCNLNDYTYYSCSLKDLYIAEITHREPKYKDSTIMRKTQCIKMLDLMYYRGGWQKGELNPLPLLSQEAMEFLDAQDKYLQKTGHSECSCLTMRKGISGVLRYFQSIGVTKLSQIDKTHISSYVLSLNGHARSTMRCELSRLRKFLSYLYLLNYTDKDLTSFVPQYRLGGSQSMVKIWESDEIEAVLEAVDRSSVKGKRDYAFILIAAELGVRSKDIRELKVSDFDWEICSISFQQSKTHNPNVLPLSERVGSAVIDYLQVRPETDHDYLFVSMNPPYDKLQSFGTAFKRYVSRSGVKIPTKAHHSLHSLRATAATKLLDAGVSPDVIFSFLGHSDRDSLVNYIRLDIETLRECALSFEDGELL
mgnify:CR=1 FL=1